MKSADEFVDEWKTKNFPPLPRNEEWEQLKWHVCEPNAPLNPILRASGGEIQVEQFGIIGWLDKVECKDGTCSHFYQCALIEARETGTGRFLDWLKNVKAFVHNEFDAPFALTTITNGRLYKYCMKADVYVAQDGVLYKVKMQQDEEVH